MNLWPYVIVFAVFTISYLLYADEKIKNQTLKCIFLEICILSICAMWGMLIYNMVKL